MIINALMTLIATSVVNMLYNKYAVKKPMCLRCGSTGKRLVGDRYVKCDCRKETLWIKLVKKIGNI